MDGDKPKGGVASDTMQQRRQAAGFAAKLAEAEEKTPLTSPSLIDKAERLSVIAKIAAKRKPPATSTGEPPAVDEQIRINSESRGWRL